VNTANAAPILTIADDDILGFQITIAGSVNDITVPLPTEEGIGVVGHVDMQAHWVDPTTPLAAGGAIAIRENFLESPGGPVSDTLDIVFSGSADPLGGVLISMDLHFLSDSLDGIAPPELVGGGSFVESSVPLIVTVGQASFTISSDSDIAVPEPTTIAMFGAGLLGLGVLRRRRSKLAKTN
jgi:hypothetical protein